MCLLTLHDRVRNLGLGAMYEKHWGNGGFRDLFDNRSPGWSATAMPEKVIDLQAFEAAGVPVGEIIGHYRETLARQPEVAHVLDSLPATMRAYRDAGYRPRLPDDIEAALEGSDAS
jgi:hypothetical protein